MSSDSDGREVFVSVDIEASGQSPAVGSMLSIGACLVDRIEEGIYIELKPLSDKGWSESAEKIHGLTRERLEQDGMEPADALSRLEEWLDYACAGGRPVFVGFNAPFDWMFVADYFWRYLARNPFGVSALDLKSYYMAAELIPRWDMTRRVNVDEKLGLRPDHSHHALEDAQGQAVLARILLGRNVGSG